MTGASSSATSTSSAGSQGDEDGDWLYRLACVETIVPLVTDVTPAAESDAPLPDHPVAAINYSANFKFIYGVYRALRGRLVYAPAVGDRRAHAGGPTPPPPPPVIHAIHTSAARWLLLLAFALRQCTSNYTVWKDRRDILMSPAVVAQATRDALPALSVPADLLSGDADKLASPQGVQSQEKQRKLTRVAQHWLPAREDVMWKGQPSPWRAVRWELLAIGCFTRLYHKNFQVWHHRRELLTYALQQSPTHVPCPSEGATAAVPQTPLLASEAAFSDYLHRQHGLDFAAVDERPTLRAVLCDGDSKNYHAWLHLSWYLHAFSFLVAPPAWTELAEYAAGVTATLAEGEVHFTPHPSWIQPSESTSTPAALSPTLPPSPFTEELQFTAQLIHQDWLNNSAWCHRLFLFRENLLRCLWRRSCAGTDGPTAPGEDWQRVVRVLCAVELDYTLQWLYIDPSNEAAHTHARSVALLYHTLVTRRHVSAAEETRADGSVDLRRYLAEAPLLPPVAAANAEMCTNADDGTVSPATPVLDRLLRTRQRCIPWHVCQESFSLLLHVQRVLHTAIAPRVSELEEQAARIIRAVTARNTAGTAATPHGRDKLQSLYERGSQYMLDNLHQVDAALYLASHAKLEAMWLTYMTASQRSEVHQRRPSRSYGAGLRAEWLERCPWSAQATESDDAAAAAVIDFLAHEAAALGKAKQLTIADPIRLKYWKHEALTTLCRGYEAPL
ncbi:protein farnesyltransferase alpha subunit [Novymonas esmeraldas]|uniref:Protein farnesyltransferase/geranylgeranyltransferase type-1 subunit alpha n=1 Tax=Novymonas esmeraldas TaxID=1808958 RepID=A0AAW0F3S7_9TRYP